MYSLALTAIFALTGKYPQQLSTDPQTGEIIWQPHVTGISAYSKAIFAIVLQFDPRDRYGSAREMLEALQPNQLSNQTNSGKLIPIPPRMSNMQTVAVTPRGYSAPVNQSQNQNQNQNQNKSVYVYQSQQDPKKKIVAQLIATMIAGSAIGAAIALGVVVSQNGGLGALWNKISPFNQSAAKVKFYFLADSAYKDIESANLRVEKLKAQGYKDAGVFWIPDYPNLGESKYYQVYTEKFKDNDEVGGSCLQQLSFAGLRLRRLHRKPL